MTLNNQHPPGSPSHPEELLEAYVLGALDDEDLADCEAHLELCAYCGRVMGRLLDTTAALAESAPPATPPPYLAAAVMEAVDELPPVFRPPASAEAPESPLESSATAEAPARQDNPAIVEPDADSSARFTFSSFALPLAATLVIGLISASLIMNVLTTNRLNSLEREGLDTGARLTQLEQEQSNAGARMARMDQAARSSDSALKQVMETTYLMSRPYTHPLLLLPPTDGPGSSEGILLVNNDGRKAILMLSNMKLPNPSQTYQVWLARNGQQFPVGRIAVDATGWGTMALTPPESLYGFDWINLTMDEPETPGGSSGEMVLQTRIISPAAR